MLRATFQWFAPYHGNTIKRVSSRPKGYIADTGFACWAQALSTPDVIGGHPLRGPLFETAVAGEIRRQCSAMASRPNVYRWRSHGGAEVDCLLEWNGKLFPIEVKANSTPNRNDTRGISAFRETHPRLAIARGLVIGPTQAVAQVSDLDYAVSWDLA